MKVYNRILVMLSLTGIMLSGCSEDDPAKPSQEAQQLEKLSATWAATSVTVDGNDKTTDYSSFELTISGSADAAVYSYGVVGRPLLSPWPEEGTWSFGLDVTSDLVRDPATAEQLQMNYSVTDTQLIIEFSFTGTGYNAAKAGSAAGNWVYTFSRN